MRSQSVFNSSAAAGYYARMVSHFGHKIPVEDHGTEADLHFICGDAQLRLEGDCLHLQVQSEAAEGLDQTREVIESHLLRFAFREDPQPLEWRDI